ncbi:MAG: hypothetical protein U0795_10725 [Pirellulales bacterium]
MIVWERGGRWAAWSRLVMGELGERLIEARTLADCWQAFVAQPAQGVLIEFRPERWQTQMEAVHRLATWGPGPKCLIAVGGPEIAVAKRSLIEAGVIHVATSPRELPLVAELMMRHRQYWAHSKTFPRSRAEG